MSDESKPNAWGSPKPRLRTVEQARHALAKDGLGCVYVKADRVFVVTAYGLGEFSRREWQGDSEGEGKSEGEGDRQDEGERSGE